VVRSVNAGLCECASQRAGVQAAEALGAEIGMAHHEGWQNSEFFCDAIRAGTAAMRALQFAGFWTQVSCPEFPRRVFQRDFRPVTDTGVGRWPHAEEPMLKSRQPALRTELDWAVE
jgi:hypothetical protein